MKRPDDVRREFVRDRLRKADHDLLPARVLLESAPELAYGVAFHAQQAPEKHLKAVLVWHQIEFGKTHDIGRIVDLLKLPAPALAEVVRDAAFLTPLGVEVRYPGEQADPSREEAAVALAIAERVRAAVLAHLPESLHPPR